MQPRLLREGGVPSQPVDQRERYSEDRFRKEGVDRAVALLKYSQGSKGLRVGLTTEHDLT